MQPVTPIIPGMDLPETVYAKDQPEYIPLPVYRDPEGIVTSRWELSWKERLRVLWSGSIWLQVHTFNQKLQPVRVLAEPPDLTSYGGLGEP